MGVMLTDELRESLLLYLEKYYIEEPKEATPSAIAEIEKEGHSGNIFGTDLPVADLQKLIENAEETFCEMLFRLMDEKGLGSADVYKKAGVDRKLFSKLKTNPAYHPSKGTVMALGIGLELTIEEFNEFLARAEYALSPSNKGDLIVRFFVENGIYDIMIINFTLDEYGQRVLG